MSRLRSYTMRRLRLHAMRGARAPRGFTLVEGLVVVALLALAWILFWQLLAHGRKREAKVDFRAGAAQAAAIARARLAADFAEILPAAASAPESARGQAVSFDVVSSSASGEGGLPLDAKLTPKLESVTYRFDPASHRLLRNGALIQAGPFRDVRFSFSSGPDRAYTLLMDLEMVPEGQLDLPTPEQLARFRFAFHSPQGTLEIAHRNWAGDRGL